jgi:glycosyltransferase involved in cell wall biosynthesis
VPHHPSLALVDPCGCNGSRSAETTARRNHSKTSPTRSRDRETGLLVPIGDPETISTTLQRLTDDSSLAERLRQYAAKYVLRRGGETMVEAVMAVYRNMLGGKRKLG